MVTEQDSNVVILEAYRDAWLLVVDSVLNERTGWGKEQLRQRMRDVLLECMTAKLSSGTRTNEGGKLS